MSPVWTRVRTPPAPQKSYVEHSLRRIFFTPLICSPFCSQSAHEQHSTSALTTKSIILTTEKYRTFNL